MVNKSLAKPDEQTKTDLRVLLQAQIVSPILHSISSAMPSHSNRTSDKSKYYPFTEDGIRERAQQVYERRVAAGLDGTPEDDWRQAFRELKWKRSFLGKFCRWTGLGQKKGWDLFTSISLPIVLFLGGSLFTYWNNQQQQRIAVENREQDLQIADEKQKDEVLKIYMDSMKELLLDEKFPLRQFKSGNERRNIARTLTLTTLGQLTKRDKQAKNETSKTSVENVFNQRKGLVIRFLSESGLVQETESKESYPIISLNGADLADAPLQGNDLSSADLTGANLKGASFSNIDFAEGHEEIRLMRLRFQAGVSSKLFTSRIATLENANLRDANLEGANLTHVVLVNAVLDNANLKSTNLAGADLAGTIRWTDEQLSKAKLCKTKLPEGSLLNPDRDCKELGIEAEF